MKPQTLTFTDCVSRFGKRIYQENLNDLYRKAGRALKDHLKQLKQHFVVLTDYYMSEIPASDFNQTSQGNRKRSLKDQQACFEREGAKGREGVREGRGGRVTNASKNGH
jgi:hypothetical protein